MVHNNKPDWQHTTTTENDAEKPQSFLQQVRKLLNGKKAKREREWEREARGGIVCGPQLPCIAAGAGQTIEESNWGLIPHRMHRQSSAGPRSKWELVHYGSAARYFQPFWSLVRMRRSLSQIKLPRRVSFELVWQKMCWLEVTLRWFPFCWFYFGVTKCLLGVKVSMNSATHWVQSQMLKINCRSLPAVTVKIAECDCLFCGSCCSQVLKTLSIFLTRVDKPVHRFVCQHRTAVS